VNSSRYYLEKFISQAAAATPCGALILDAGAGDCRYKKYFGHAQYESADFAQANKSYGELTYICDITDIPVSDGRFQTVLCSQVLAHLPNPGAALCELFRVLHPGGRLFLTAPLFFQENEAPYDFYRFTQYGLQHAFATAGFRIESLDWLEGYCGTLGYQLGMASRQLPSTGSAYGGGVLGMTAAGMSLLARPTFALLSRIYSNLDRRHRWTKSGMCKNYAVVALRP
jgi:SAM-dependent methyltransferase